MGVVGYCMIQLPWKIKHLWDEFRGYPCWFRLPEVGLCKVLVPVCLVYLTMTMPRVHSEEQESSTTVFPRIQTYLLVLDDIIGDSHIRRASIYNESARMKAQGQDRVAVEGWTKDISKDEDLIAMIYCNR
uniref:Uncharacterized protein n=1 Tax=Tanacetum cinerariifolium TaxID=118510 RepID=A0A699HLH8_TANCI|nr:hypothetical protein [Tanacetum cinerariifolium]